MMKLLLKSRAVLLGILVGSVGISGCGNAVAPEAVTPPPPPAAKALLSDVANSGELGSGASTIRDALATLQATDAAKADPLLKEMDELETLSDPAKIKAKAKAMADKL